MAKSLSNPATSLCCDEAAAVALEAPRGLVALAAPSGVAACALVFWPKRGLYAAVSFLPVPFTPLMFIRSTQQMSDPKRDFRWKHDWVSAREISPHLRLAVICAEDQNFYAHWGFDLEAIGKAVEHNKKSRRKRGASTISQQTAKNVFLWPGRSWVRKELEVWFTGLIELFWSKKRILHVYLNSIELGDGIYGAEAASQHFFNVSFG